MKVLVKLSKFPLPDQESLANSTIHSILHACHKRIHEVNLVRGTAGDIICNWDIERLNAIKRQLLGY
jgi:hypothetical protein